MKKTLLALFVSVMTLAAYAQPDVVNAKLSFDDGDFASAKESIDKAITNEKAAAKEKTWRYRGNIYMQVALDSAMFLNNPDALDEAYKA
ncbi:MAG: hypothetical protein ACJAU0_002329, partial [Flavobacteriales bacterium]